MNEKIILECISYKRIFECAQNVGIENTIKFFKGIEELKKVDLIKSAFLDGAHHTLSLIRNNQRVINFLRSYKSDLNTLSFNYNMIINTLENTHGSIEVLNTYIDNMNKLEELNVDKIRMIESRSITNPYRYCELYRDKLGTIIIVHKYYTDGIIESNKKGKLVDEDFRVSQIDFKIAGQPTFLLDIQNVEYNRQYRSIEIAGFDFNSSALPSEEEISSYDIPSSLKLRK